MAAPTPCQAPPYRLTRGTHRMLTDYTTRPLLSEPWILDIDTTVKPLYGHQEGAVVSYNPTKRGRPSHSYHCYMMGNLRLVLAVEVVPGNQHTSKHSSPRLWDYLDGLSAELRPWLIRGDVGFGNEPVMREAERRRQPYLFGHTDEEVHSFRSMASTCSDR